jgi:outer membrane protein assembly factor BamE
MKSLRPVVLLSASFLSLTLPACTVVDWMTYKLPIQQGNFLEQKDVDKLRPGMSRDQVLFVLGNPIARSSFDDTRWEYVYTLRLGGDVTNQKNLTAFFKQDSLERIEGDFKAPEAFTASATP